MRKYTEGRVRKAIQLAPSPFYELTKLDQTKKCEWMKQKKSLFGLFLFLLLAVDYLTRRSGIRAFLPVRLRR